jgi:tetratricopeptide (TPR) repeat protein
VLGRLLVALLHAGVELQRHGTAQVRPDLDRLLSEFETSNSELRTSEKFRKNLDGIVRGLRESNALLAAEGFSGVSDVMEDEHPKQRAALASGQVAVSLDPDSAIYAWRMGRLKRIRADSEAPSWYRRAVELGSVRKTWEPVARSYLGLSGIQLEQKDYVGVEHFALLALRTARSAGLRKVVPEAFHNLAIACFGLGRAPEGVNYARLALEEYDRSWPHIAVLANDVATYMYLEIGEFDRALPLLKSALHAVEGNYNKLCVMGNIARAAGGVGNRDDFDWAAEQVYRLSEQVLEKQGAVDALVDVARGASTANWLDEAEHALAKAREAALVRRTSDTRSIKPIAENLQVLRKAEVQRRQRLGDGWDPAVGGGVSARLINVLKSTKMNAPLKRLLETAVPNTQSTSVSIDCNPEYAEDVEGLVRELGGTLKGTVPTLKGASVFANVPADKIAAVIDSPVVQFVSLPLQYSVD